MAMAMASCDDMGLVMVSSKEEAILPRVDVLMATYNGGAYLREQIDSVLAQRDVDVRLVIRDDGSSDDTPAILLEYERLHPGKVVILASDEVRYGASQNFMFLMEHDSAAEYFAFCDQDDVWQADKLCHAVASLRSAGISQGLYCSAVSYVDERLRLLGSSSRMVTPSFKNAMVENIAQGCTMVFDAGLRQLVVARMPKRAAMHDWWMYLVATAFGRVVYDPRPHLFYRQHGGNVVGGNFSFMRKISKNWTRYRAGNGWQMAAQAEELLRLYPALLTQEQREHLTGFVEGKHSLPHRLGFLFDWSIRRQSLLETLIVKMLVLINAY